MAHSGQLEALVGQSILDGGDELALQLLSAIDKVAELAETSNAEGQNAVLHSIFQLEASAQLGKDLCGHC